MQMHHDYFSCCLTLREDKAPVNTSDVEREMPVQLNVKWFFCVWTVVVLVRAHTVYHLSFPQEICRVSWYTRLKMQKC